MLDKRLKLLLLNILKLYHTICKSNKTQELRDYEQTLIYQKGTKKVRQYLGFYFEEAVKRRK